MKLELDADGLALQLSADGGATSFEGWIRLRLQARAFGFTGDFEVSLQKQDFEDFARALQQMQRAPGHPAVAELSGAEPDFFLRLSMGGRGDIHGEYALESERIDGVPTVLKGSCRLDQSYLPALIRQALDFARLPTPE